ncbi:unnamed protein product [Cladocopium goreaui]|uniref:Polyketide synthase 3 n=1 Tax=Cladocopium goreaui TaxID=2562237 RepID=A0A9P1BKT8_9DINO|nr:unnamed protein product [Cladocopium goreaui]
MGVFTLEIVLQNLEGPKTVGRWSSKGEKKTLALRLSNLAPVLLEASLSGEFHGRGKALVFDLPAELQSGEAPLPLWIMLLLLAPGAPEDANRCATLVASSCIDLRYEVMDALNRQADLSASPVPFFRRCRFGTGRVTGDLGEDPPNMSTWNATTSHPPPATLGFQTLDAADHGCQKIDPPNMVVSVAELGGAMVREGKSLSSRLVARLGVGAVVSELERAGERLRFKKVSGSGPESGWVSLAAQIRRRSAAGTLRRIKGTEICAACGW